MKKKFEKNIFTEVIEDKSQINNKENPQSPIPNPQKNIIFYLFNYFYHLNKNI